MVSFLVFCKGQCRAAPAAGSHALPPDVSSLPRWRVCIAPPVPTLPRRLTYPATGVSKSLSPELVRRLPRGLFHASTNAGSAPACFPVTGRQATRTRVMTMGMLPHWWQMLQHWLWSARNLHPIPSGSHHRPTMSHS